VATDFAWDPRKAAANVAKHGEVARLVFADPFAVIDSDDREDYGEERQTIIGMVGNRLLFVVFTEEVDGTIRLVSARKSTSREKRRYHEAQYEEKDLTTS
jgi:uncharacterized protein